MLFLGSLLRIIVECRSHDILQRDVVAAMMKILDPDYDETKNELSSHLIAGNKNPPRCIMESVRNISPDQRPSLIHRFNAEVVSLINQNSKSLVVSAIELLVLDDSNIGNDTIINEFTGRKKQDLKETKDDIASFLLGLFIYTLKNTSNRQEKGKAREIASVYLEKARTIKSSVESSENKNNGELEKIPTSVIVQLSRFRFFDENHLTSNCVALLLGKWDEKNSYDKQLIEKLTGKLYSDFYEDIRSQNELSVTSKQGIIACLDANQYRARFVEDVDYSHLNMFFDMLMEVLYQTSDFFRLSSECISGIVDSLAYIGCNISHSQHLGQSMWKRLLTRFLEKVFDEPLWILLFSNEFEMLLEADIHTYLDVIDTKIETENSIFIELIRTQISFIYPLAYSLRKAAGSDAYFTFAIRIMFVLSKYHPVFSDNIIYTLHPTYLQTEATKEVREGVIRYFFIQDERKAWNILVSLLPGYNAETMQISEFHYYPLHLRYDSNSKKAETKFCISMACDNMNGKIDRAIDLIKCIPFLSVSETKDISTSIMKSIKPSMDTIAICDAVTAILSQKSTFSKEEKYVIERLKNYYSNPISDESCTSMKPETRTLMMQTKYQYLIKCIDLSVLCELEGNRQMVDFLVKALHRTNIDDNGFSLYQNTANSLEFHSSSEVLAYFELAIMNYIEPIKLDSDNCIPERVVNDLINHAYQYEKNGYLRVARAYRNVAEILKIQFEE